MLRLTRAARIFIVEYRRELGFDESHAPRFIESGGNVTLIFAERPAPDDVLVAGGSVPIYVAPDVASKLDRATIDARIERDEPILVIRERWLAVPGASWLH
jgi:hypothetical protein